MAGRKSRHSAGSLAVLALALLAVLFLLGFLLFVGRGARESTPELLERHAREGRLTAAESSPQTRTAPPEQPLPAATPLPAPEPEKQASSGFLLAAAGTVFVPRAVREFAFENGRYDFSTVFLGLGPSLTEADLSVLTLETVTDERQPYDGVNAPPALLDALRSSGVDLVSLGTEHALEKGWDALAVTQAELTTRSMAQVGIRTDEGSLPGEIFSVNGIRVALLGYTYLPEGTLASGQLASLDEDAMARDIATVRAQGAEVVIVMAHWGVKNRQETPQSVRRLARRLCEAGADIILGTHPNIVQPIERMTVTRNDGLAHEALAVYSLGSLLTDARAPENTAGLVVQVPVEYDSALRRVSIGEMRLLPTYVARQEEEGVLSWRVVEAEDETAISALNEQERAAARRAAALVRAEAEGGEVQ